MVLGTLSLWLGPADTEKEQALHPWWPVWERVQPSVSNCYGRGGTQRDESSQLCARVPAEGRPDKTPHMGVEGRGGVHTPAGPGHSEWRFYPMQRSGGRTFTGTSKIYNSRNSSNLLSTYYVPCQVLHTCSVISVFPRTLQGDRNYHYSRFTDEETKAQRGPAAQHRASMWESQNLKAGLSDSRDNAFCPPHSASPGPDAGLHH